MTLTFTEIDNGYRAETSYDGEVHTLSVKCSGVQAISVYFTDSNGVTTVVDSKMEQEYSQAITTWGETGTLAVEVSGDGEPEGTLS